MQASNGSLYGTTIDPIGAVYSFNPTNSAYSVWIISYPTSGYLPTCTLVQDRVSGLLWGTTTEGQYNGPGFTEHYGSIFKITLTGQLTNVYTLYYYMTHDDGAYPWAGLIQGSGSDNNFYGTNDGAIDTYQFDYGNVFKIDSSGNYTILHKFN